MQKGDIVLIQFPFSDLSGNKKRPALVLVGRELDITVAFISTQLKWKEPTDILLKPTKENGLKRDSIIRLAKLATIDKGLALGLIGRVNKHNIQAINRNLIEIFKL